MESPLQIHLHKGSTNKKPVMRQHDEGFLSQHGANQDHASNPLIACFFLFGGFSVFKAELCRRNEVNPAVTSKLMHRERQHDGGFLSQNGTPRRNEVNPVEVTFYKRN